MFYLSVVYPYIQPSLVAENCREKNYVMPWLMNMGVEACKWKCLTYTWRELTNQKCQVGYYMFAKYTLKMKWMFY